MTTVGDPDDALVIAHLSDLHLDLGEVRLRRARRVADHIRAMAPRPDLVVVTGDVTDHGTPEEYAQAADVLAGLGACMIPGNHDRRPEMRALLGMTGDGPITRTLVVGRTTVVLADTHVPGQAHGELAAPSVDAVARAAAGPEPLVVAVHHPPLTIGSGLLDPIRLLDPEPLLAPLRGRRAPSVVLCGHAHTPLSTSVDSVPVRIAPSTASTLRLPFEPRPDTLDDGAPPAFALHRFDQRTGRLDTHVRVLADH